MADEFGRAFVEIVPDFKNFNKDADRNIKRSLGDAGDGSSKEFGKRFTGGIRGLAGPIAGAVAALGIGNLIGDAVSAGFDFAKQGIDVASGLNEAVTAIDSVFGDGADQVKAFAKTTNRSLGQSRLSALKAAQTFGVYGRAANLSGQENADFSKTLVSLASDLASFYDTSPEEAIEALGSGLRGEAEPLRRYGVLLDDATLRQKALELGLIETTKNALTPQQRVLAAQASILQQTGVAQGDFAKTSDGLANQQRILAASIEDVQGRLGEKLLPGLLGLVGIANERLVPAFEGFIDKVGPVLGDALDKAAPKMQVLLDRAAPLAEEFATLAAEKGIPAAVDGLEALVDAAPAVIDAFEALTAPDNPLTNFNKLLTEFADNINGENGLINDLVAGMKESGFFGKGGLDPLGQDYIWGQAGKDAGTAFGYGAAGGLKQVPFGVEVQKDLKNTPTFGFQTGDQVGQKLGEGARSGFERRLISPDVKKDLDTLAPFGFSAGSEVGNGLVRGLDSKQRDVGAAADRLANTIRQRTNSGLQIASPSKVAIKQGGFYGEGWVIGLDKSRADVAAAAGRLVSFGGVDVGSISPTLSGAGIGGGSIPGRGGFNNYGTIQVTDEAALVDEVNKKARRADALSGINTMVVA